MISISKFCDCNHKFLQHISNLPIHSHLHRVEQEISLTYLQTKHFLFRGGGGFFSFTLSKHFCGFSGKICCNETTVPRDLSGGHGSSFDGVSFCRR
ncbi:uncharacterized protein G2W53_015022 [Senna tora]|uniref:Uncharacterized protein n=1 Tax=Senna tora TaxID=362788 RepID=A0A834WUH0_9FABA|nr:uncharacterized protein G2W53_015022 [Senna tora]